jgi:hypothetical protein
VEQQVDFNNYKAVVLINNNEIIVKNLNNYDFIDIVNNAPCLVCTGILNNSWIDLTINNANIIYIRELFDGEKRIVRQLDK